MIELNLLINLPRRQKRSLIDAFLSLAKWARAEQGCFSADLFVAASNPHCLRYVETWRTMEELRQMILTQHFSKLIALMELAAEAPVCEFKVIEKNYGLEFAAEVRNCPVGSSTPSAGLTAWRTDEN